VRSLRRRTRRFHFCRPCGDLVAKLILIIFPQVRRRVVAHEWRAATIHRTYVAMSNEKHRSTSDTGLYRLHS
jgi:hypothetical protein